MKPRIAIPVPTTADTAYNTLNWQAYADAVAASGGEPVRFSLGGSRRDGQERVQACQGIVLPGSPADVSPSRYGQSKDEASAEADEAREALDELLIEVAERSGRPLLAICFGAQMLNVVRGGTLVQDLAALPVNHAAGRAVGVAHSVAVDEGSFLAGMVDRGEVQGVRLPVNSSHHQAIAIGGRSLRVAARCPQDGVIEAVEDMGAGGFLVGVQWHPERTFSTSATSRTLFSRFVQVASEWRNAGVLSPG